LGINFLAKQNNKLKAMTATRCNISSVGTTNQGKGGQQYNKGKGAKKVASKKKTKDYCPKDWWALTNEQRNKICEDHKKNRAQKVSLQIWQWLMMILIVILHTF
jgi:hypothetical protein